MSRVGKKPIPIPDKTTVEIKDAVVTVKGQKGTLSRTLPEGVELVNKDGVLTVTPVNEDRKTRAMQGLVRSLVDNMVTGVSKGFTRVLEITGIGYRAEVAGTTLTLNVGYSHPINFPLPDGISASVDKKNAITLEGIDKELLGRTAAKIRSFRPPEPYKGKGIKYQEETIMRKAGKTGAK